MPRACEVTFCLHCHCWGFVVSDPALLLSWDQWDRGAGDFQASRSLRFLARQEPDYHALGRSCAGLSTRIQRLHQHVGMVR